MSYRDIDPKLAGIYIFKNNINNKCYVGQGVSLRKRIKHHFSNMKTKRYDLPLYRAIEKYGIHNFTIDILESFIPDDSLTSEDLIKKLDDLEIKYIDLYKAYTEGYNCTKGGDYGVLGLKMTKEQKQKISEISKQKAQNYYKPVYLYNIKDKYTIYAISVTHASNIVRFHRSCIIRCANGKYNETHGYLAAYSEEELKAKISSYKRKSFNSTKY
jgi:group I intron endonuclease